MVRLQQPKSTSIRWDATKRLALSAAFSVTTNNHDAARLWASKFPEDAVLKTDLNHLVRVLSAQYNERNKSSTWLGIPLRRDELEEAAPALLREFTQALKSGTAASTSTLSTPGKLLSSGSSSGATSSVSSPCTPVSSTVSSYKTSTTSTPLERATASSTVLPSTFLPRIHGTSSAPRLDPSSPTSPTSPTSPRRGRASQAELQRRLQESRSKDHGPFQVVPFGSAHPSKPALLYRFYKVGDTHVVNAPLTRGFVAGYFKDIKSGISAPLPYSTEFLFAQMEHHVNRTLIPSPFISTCSDLLWTIHQAAKPAHSQVRISIVDTQHISRTSIYHLRPFNSQLRHRRAFVNGGWRPAGNVR